MLHPTLSRRLLLSRRAIAPLTAPRIRTYSSGSTLNPPPPTVPTSTSPSDKSTSHLTPSPEEEESLSLTTPEDRIRTMQAPNRATTWSSSQNPRALAMTGPRFEQTDLVAQPRAHAAIELIHQQPVKFVEKRTAVCDGGGGPHGHPRIFINVDKPEIVPCGYCGLPFAYSHHKEYLESLPSTEYPLS